MKYIIIVLLLEFSILLFAESQVEIYPFWVKDGEVIASFIIKDRGTEKVWYEVEILGTMPDGTKVKKRFGYNTGSETVSGKLSINEENEIFAGEKQVGVILSDGTAQLCTYDFENICGLQLNNGMFPRFYFVFPE